MSKYKVLGKEFDTYEDVVKWAWNTHKIDEGMDEPTTEEEKQDACNDLENMLINDMLTDAQ
jgi:hypothetical protein